MGMNVLLRLFCICVIVANVCVATLINPPVNSGTSSKWFKQVSTNYKPHLAEILGRFSSVSYCTEKDLSKWDCPRCSISGVEDYKTERVLSDKDRDLQGVVGTGRVQGKLAVVVAFRGTIANDYVEWVNNLRSTKSKIGIVFMWYQFKILAVLTMLIGFAFLGMKDHPGVMVHSGFFDDYNKELRKQVIPVVTRLKKAAPKAIVYVTGHSLGGALATLFALDWVLSTGDKPHVYTFGKPRIGNDKFSELYDSLIPDSFRLVHERDLIPHLPPQMFGYIHGNTEVWLHKNKTVICTHGPEDPACSASIYFTLDIADHMSYLGVSMDSNCHPENKTRNGANGSGNVNNGAKVSMQFNREELEKATPE